MAAFADLNKTRVKIAYLSGAVCAIALSCSALAQTFVGATEICNLEQLADALFDEHQQNRTSLLIHRLEKLAPFRAALKKQGLSWRHLNNEKKVSWFKWYLKEVYGRYTAETIKDLEEAALAKSLTAHGVKIQGRSARNALEQTSKTNLERILPKIDRSRPIDAKIETAVDSLEIYFEHHTNMLYEPPQSAILSSGEMEKITGRGGLWSSNDFNSVFMEQKDNVFFFVMIGRKDQSRSSPYGSHSIVVDTKYAQEHGWISSFVMYPSDLQKNAKTLGFDDDRNFPTHDQYQKDFTKRLAPHEKTALLRARNHLHKADFTVGDFETLVKTQLKHELQRLKDEEPLLYQQAILDLARDERSRTAALDRLVFQPLSLPRTYEFKIPVLVPRDQVEYRELKPDLSPLGGSGK